MDRPTRIDRSIGAFDDHIDNGNVHLKHVGSTDSPEGMFQLQKNLLNDCFHFVTSKSDTQTLDTTTAQYLSTNYLYLAVALESRAKLSGRN